MSTFNIQSDILPLNIDFEVKKLGILKVKGKFTQTSGEVYFDQDSLDTSFFDLAVAVESIKTTQAKRDQHMLDKDFFDAKKYKVITFRSTKISSSLDGFYASGELTIKEITHKIDIGFQVSDNGTLYGMFTINRKKFNVGTKFPSALISKNILVEFNLKT